MYNNNPTKLTLEHSNSKITCEMVWDASMDVMLSNFFGMCVAATWHPTTILENMAEFASEKLESLRPKEERKELSAGDSIKEKINLRQEANREILAILSEFVEKYPDIRFGQALANIGVIQYNDNGETKDPFGEESIDMLRRLNCKG